MLGNRYFAKQGRPKRKASECSISSGSALFAKTKLIFREINSNILKIITCDPSIYTMDHPDLTVSNFMEKRVCRQRVNGVPLLFSGIL